MADTVLSFVSTLVQTQIISSDAFLSLLQY